MFKARNLIPRGQQTAPFRARIRIGRLGIPPKESRAKARVGSIFLMVLSLLAVISINCYAQDADKTQEAPVANEVVAEQPIPVSRETPATQETVGEQAGVGTLEGTIKSVDQDQLTFKFSYPITFAFEELNFTILPMTEIIKNMENADFMDMRPGDRAIVDYIDDSSDPLKAVRITLVGNYEE